ncbi:MAG TPA: ATP-binding protein [Micavibrio sp.]|nr:ATP-binding protein [Micavibrio sp.]
MAIKGLASFRGKWGAAAFLAAMLCALLTAPVFSARAEESVLGGIVLGESLESIPLARHMLVQPDPDGEITVSSIIEHNAANLKGKMREGDQLHLGYDGTPVWLTLKVRGNSHNDEWIIDLGRRAEGRMGYLKSVHVYEMLLTSPVTVKEIRPLHGEGVYNIRVAKGDEKFILFSVAPSAGKPTILPVKIFSETAYINAIKRNNSFENIYSTLLAALGAVFLAMSAIARKPAYSVFGTYFFFTLLFWISYNNLSVQSGPGLFGEIMLFFALGHSIFAIYMTKIFWGIEYGSYTEKYILYGLVWLNVVASALSMLLPVGDGVAHIALFYGAPIITVSILCLMSLAQSRTIGVKGNFYLLSWLFPLAGLIATVLGACRVLPPVDIVLNGFWYSVVGQGVMLAIAMYRRFEAMGSERAIGADTLSLHRLKETKDAADNSRLLKVIQKEREMLAEFRTKEAIRMEEMRVAKEEADEANRAKSAFLAVVSHEIRTPMSGVMGMVKLLLDSNITKQQRDYAITIKESGEAMLGLLNDILDFEKIQRGKMELENISFDLHRMIQGIVTLMSGHAAEKNITLSARMDEDTPRFVKGDPTRLRQILLNLMGNAIKFTETGTVTLFIKNLNQPESDDMPFRHERHMVYFAVQDSGIGISREQQKNLFNPFSQANSSVARKFGGSGLGLAISKGLVEAMGSAININSREGEGSTFFFTLEMEKGISGSHDHRRAKAPQPAQEKDAEPMKILVVDDNTITRKVMVGFLEQGGHDIVTSGTAEDALKKIDQEEFDLIFMDIELPGIRGDEATKILRDHANPLKAALPVIAITGNISKEDMEHYLSEGMNAVLPKPIDADKLKSIVNEIAAKRFEREIKMPGHESLDIDLPDDFDSFALPPESERPVVANGIFNPVMLQGLKDAIGGRQLEELLSDLINKTDEILQQMDEAAKLGDLQALAARAHELKGMAGNFGLVEISTIAAEAEKKAKTNETDGLGALVNALPDASARAQTALKDWVSH